MLIHPASLSSVFFSLLLQDSHDSGWPVCHGQRILWATGKVWHDDGRLGWRKPGWVAAGSLDCRGSRKSGDRWWHMTDSYIGISHRDRLSSWKSNIKNKLWLSVAVTNTNGFKGSASSVADSRLKLKMMWRQWCFFYYFFNSYFCF